MIQLHLQNREDLNRLVAFRKGETKLGESILLCDSLEQIKESTAQFVIFGISEDIGVQANYGNPGTRNAWNAFLASFVNVQDNVHNEAHQILVLGNITVTPTSTINGETSRQELGAVIARIDSKVAQVVETIVAAGKIPIIIGGGHNNALGNLQGAATALQSPINAINIDAHTDLRLADYRHSGNGFRYALEHKPQPFLQKYMVFGLQKNYTPQYIFEDMNKQPQRLQYCLYEDLLLENNLLNAFNEQLDFVSDQSFGLELDCDAIANFSSSAQTPSGFKMNEVRRFIRAAAARKTCCYFHICEAAPSEHNSNQIGKALSYFVTDFIREYRAHHSLS